MRVEDDIVALVPKGSPVLGSHKVIGDHHRDTLVTLLDFGVSGLEVRVHVVDSVRVADGLRGGKLGKVVASFVDGRDGELRDPDVLSLRYLLWEQNDMRRNLPD